MRARRRTSIVPEPDPRLRIRGVALACLLVASCAPDDRLPDPRTLPWRFEVERRFGEAVQAVDLTGDGAPELVRLVQASSAIGAVQLQSPGGAFIEQVNFAGTLQPPLQFVDLDGNGVTDVAVPFTRDDSLFLGVVDGTGRRVTTVFLATRPVIDDPAGPIPWDPRIFGLSRVDVDGDGSAELVTVIATAYARSPRGVLVHDLPGGRLLGEVMIGAHPGTFILDDFDADGITELLIGSTAVNNGASAGGFDDRSAWLIEIELHAQPVVRWSRRVGERWQFTRLAHADMDGDGSREILAVTGHHVANTAETVLEVIEPGSWRTLRRRVTVEPIRSAQLFTMDREGRQRLIGIRQPDELWAFDDRLETAGRWRFPFRIRDFTSIPDLDQDGLEEIGLLTGENDVAVLGPDFRLMAVLDGAEPLGVFRPRATDPALLLARVDEGVVGFRFVRNRPYLIHRHGPAVASLAGFAGLIVLLFASRSDRRRARLLCCVQAAELDGDARSLLVLDRGGRLAWANGTASRRFGRVSPRAIVSFVRGRLDPASPVRVRGSIDLDGAGTPSTIEAEPMRLGTRRDPHWLVRIDARENGPASSQDDTTRLAEQVARSMANPLTGLRLTLHRLELEYRENAPGIASRLDRYTRRIDEGIDELHGLVRGFLKLIDAEPFARRSFDPNELVERFAAGRRRTLPPDIRLEVRIEPGLPALAGDPEQVTVMLRHITDNAVGAMPDGGVITIATSRAADIQWTAADPPRTYVAIETFDTGNGIPDHLGDRLFEYGTTGPDGRGGLGLAIVRRIAELHGGHVTVQSEPDAGTSITVYFPATPAEASP